MCGRYYINEEAWEVVRDDFPELTETNPFMNPSLRLGDITPAMNVVSLVAVDSRETGQLAVHRETGQAADSQETDQPIRPAPLLWGFPGFDGKSLIINARAEGIADKPTFAESIRARRCVLPASGFYEWDRSRQKVTFTLDGRPVIYLAGIYRPYGDEQRFVIITREANASMTPVHDRMPLMIDPADVRTWINDPSATESFLTRQLPQLQAKRDYEQLSLF